MIKDLRAADRHADLESAQWYVNSCRIFFTLIKNRMSESIKTNEQWTLNTHLHIHMPFTCGGSMEMYSFDANDGKRRRRRHAGLSNEFELMKMKNTNCPAQYAFSRSTNSMIKWKSCGSHCEDNCGVQSGQCDDVSESWRSEGQKHW